MVTVRPMSLRQKLTGIIFLVSMTVLCLTSVFFVSIELRYIRNSLHENLVSLSEVITANGMMALATKDVQAAEDVLQTVQAQPDVVTAYFFYPEGRMVAAYSHEVSGAPRPDSSVDPEALKLEERQIRQGLLNRQWQLWDENSWVSLFVPMMVDDRPVGFFYLRSEATRIQLQMLWMLLGWLVVLGVAAMLSYLLSSRVQRIISKPVDALVERMRQVPLRHRLEERGASPPTDEFGALFEGFEEMVRALNRRDEMLLRHHSNLEKEIEIRTRELREAKEMAESATEAKSRFLANVSHEIRTPMIGVLGMSDLLRQSPLPEKEKQLVETVHQSGEALLAIINDLLDLSKAESGKLILEKVPFNIRLTIEEALRIMQIQADEKGLALGLEYPAKAPEWLRGDPVRLRQILINLIGNAIKFTGQGEVRVIVRADQAEPGENLPLQIAVQDTGVGLRPEDQERIFESFQQADSSTTRRFGGTGLGLTIVRELTEVMGGTISVASASQKGSCFTVHLTLEVAMPSEPPEELTPVEEAAAESGAIGQSVLLAEDNPTTQHLLRLLLQDAGLKVTIVENGLEAVAFLAREKVDLVLMDCQMPAMDGFEATRKLRSMGLQVPVVALTAHVRNEDEHRCLTAGMDDFLGKPFKKIELEAMLGKWLPAAGPCGLQSEPGTARAGHEAC